MSAIGEGVAIAPLRLGCNFFYAGLAGGGIWGDLGLHFALVALGD